MMHLAFMLGFLLLGGCATQYGEMGFTGGVDSQRVTSDTFRIVARGNGYTSQTAVQDFVLLKAAETTKSAGGTHFLFVGSRDASTMGTIETPGSARTTFVGNTAYTTYNPGMVSTYIRPGQDTFIKVITVPSGVAPPPGAILADEIIQFVGPRLKPPPPKPEKVKSSEAKS